MKTTSSRPPCSVYHCVGFTLIELLTVIAIIGILAAIMIPTVGAVRAKARSVQCISNLRQLHTAVLLYAGDNKGEFPYRRIPGTSDMYWKWHRLIYPYIAPSGTGATVNDYPNKGNGSLYICPVDPNPYYKQLSYGINNVLQDTRIDQFRQNPIIIADSITPEPATTQRLINSADPEPTMAGQFAYRHSNAANAVRFDGSVVSSKLFPTQAEEPQFWKAD